MKKRFGFLLFEQFEDLDFMGPWELIALWSQKHQGPQELIIVTESGAPVTSTKGLSIQANASFKNCPPLDYLLVPGGQGTRTEVDNKMMIDFIKVQAASCEQVLSVCTGAFLLQAAGLLAGKKATTHWASLERLKAFSELDVIEERFIQQEKLWISAGVSAGMDMALAFIAEIAGEKVAGDVQLFAEYYPETRVYPNSEGYLPGYVD
jgi:transcriptional regulator GlxA family with amidase domain